MRTLNPREKALIVLCFLFCLLPSAGFGYTLVENDAVRFSLESYARPEVVTFKNVVDLDSRNKDDSTVYFGIDYSLGFRYEAKDDSKQAYLKLERNGPFDYDAPLFVHNTVMTSAGVIDKYKNEELLPQVEEFWWDQHFVSGYGLKAGLYTYEVGNSFSLNGSYENYGATFYHKGEDLTWRFYYCRPELAYKNPLGPHIHQEAEQGIKYYHNTSNFIATDITVERKTFTLQPYVGVLADYTSSGKRDNAFTTPVKSDILGTCGLSWNVKKNQFYLKTEVAHNFGEAKAASDEYKDIIHSGYLGFADVGYSFNRLTPSLKGLVASGNKPTLDMARDQDLTFSGANNRAFGSYSPLNRNLSYSICSCHSDMRPVVLMGNGNGLNYGVPRPGTLDSSDFDNLMLFAPGIVFSATDKLNLSMYWYFVHSFARGVGMYNGEAKYLSKDLGQEVDLFADYQLNKNITLSFLGGYFMPGGYYKEMRDDTQGSVFSPFVRGDGAVNPAYQCELAMEMKF